MEFFLQRPKITKSQRYASCIRLFFFVVYGFIYPLPSLAQIMGQGKTNKPNSPLLNYEFSYNCIQFPLLFFLDLIRQFFGRIIFLTKNFLGRIIIKLRFRLYTLMINYNGFYRSSYTTFIGNFEWDLIRKILTSYVCHWIFFLSKIHVQSNLYW